MLDWLVVGGGIHGTALSYHLTKRMGVALDRLRVLDPHPTPLALWHHFTHNTGMTHLRSPMVHHLHPDVWSLRTFAATQAGKPLASFIPQHARPSLALFDAHSRQLIERAKLDTVRIEARAEGLHRIAGGWRVETQQGDILARHVLLAMGITEQPAYPEWASELVAQYSAIQHLFDPTFDRQSIAHGQTVVIIGGGITAGQAALALAEQQAQVLLLMRHPMRLSHYDSDPCWVTRICLDNFHAEQDYARRRAIINAARQRGSLPPEVAQALNQAIQSGNVRQRFGEVISAAQRPDGTLQLVLDDGGGALIADHVLLATGFRPERPGGVWLTDAIVDHDLPTATCGYPIVDRQLCWSEGLYVTGALAELEIGPAARNIVGARLAGERLVSVD